jgi:hypothetical protein
MRRDDADTRLGRESAPVAELRGGVHERQPTDEPEANELRSKVLIPPPDAVPRIR